MTMRKRLRIEAVVALAATLVLFAGCANNNNAGSIPTASPTRDDTSAANVDIDRRGAPQTDTRKRASIRMTLAVNYYQDGKFSVALDELKEALRLDPGYADAHSVLALVYMELRENALAEQEFRRALQIEPANSDTNNNFGWYLCRNGRERESIAYFENALKNPLYRQPAKPLQNAGVCALKLGDKTMAEDYFRRSFEIDPSGVVASQNLAELYYARKDLPRARFYVSQINNSQTPTAASLWLGIRIERQLGNRTNESALASQLDRNFGDSREAQLQRRGAYND